ncbi:MAG: hypothetical protein K8T89_25440 [Planctomycetes bacterium]|nr:hypothetical protein [Planctomycetota bacterium]
MLLKKCDFVIRQIIGWFFRETNHQSLLREVSLKLCRPDFLEAPAKIQDLIAGGSRFVATELAENVEVIHDRFERSLIASGLFEETPITLFAESRKENATIVFRELRPEQLSISDGVLDPTDACDPR